MNKEESREFYDIRRRMRKVPVFYVTERKVAGYDKYKLRIEKIERAILPARV